MSSSIVKSVKTVLIPGLLERVMQAGSSREKMVKNAIKARNIFYFYFSTTALFYTGTYTAEPGLLRLACARLAIIGTLLMPVTSSLVVDAIRSFSSQSVPLKTKRFEELPV